MRKAIPAILAALILASGPAWSATTKAPPPDVGAGRVAWFDITTADVAKARDFYGKLFDWQFTEVPGGGALEIVSGGTPIGTIRTADGKVSPFNGTVYVQVADI